MIRITSFAVAAAVLALASSAVPQEQPLGVVTEALTYASPEFGSAGLVEFPLMISRAQLRFFRPDTTDPNYYSRVFAQAVLYDTTGAAVDSNSTYFSSRVATLKESQVANQMLFNKLAMMVPPGNYSARITVIDAVSKRSFEALIQDIKVPTPDPLSLAIGGPTLAYRISRAEPGAADVNNRMVKNGLYVLNAPMGLFAHTDTVAYLYAELYGLRRGSDSADYFQSSVTVSDSAGSFSRDLGWKSGVKPGSSAAVTQAINIRDWPAGLYRVELAVVDRADQDTARASLPLRIVGPVPVSTGVEGGADPYDSLTLADKVNLVTYLLTPPEKATLQKLADAGKLTFLDQYWREHDTDPTTARIENRDEMIRRFRYANQHFSRFLTANTGWATDMGRIYMKYGPWDQRQDVPTPRVGNPFVIWYYYGVKEGQTFVFEDPLGNHDYKLVHSNAKGEKYDEAWAAKLREEMLDIR
ncbi:hypothetical protein C3F09_07205 [candidate division GN15 bacterium]|uniref:GWxTD domain-containing protein n=1 Tax=candidate division GN15 bacterium TaxID=2072418 RepID=A0A855X2C6_9BACT|nr:MAG: hypothetical protein C3F09_07205 [candidate division GN15 bacterium]